MTPAQESSAKALRNLHYRFNEVVLQGDSVVLQNRVTLLTGKTMLTTVAVVDEQGWIEMGNVAA